MVVAVAGSTAHQVSAMTVPLARARGAAVHVVNVIETGHTKHNRGMDRFHRRGRSAARTEWRLITATHNLTKLHSHTLAAATA
jgi:hypothetical protein